MYFIKGGNIQMKKKYIMPITTYSNKEIEQLESLKKEVRLSGLSNFVIDILFNRGFKTVDDIEKHLYSTLDDIHPAHLLKDSDKFVEIVSEAIKNGDEIVNYSDYDADGVTASAVTVMGIRNAGGKINYYTNNRFIEGYGITTSGIDNMLELYPKTKLIITTDNGIVAHEAIDYANSLGLKVVITDHHEQIDNLPNALAIIDPKRKDEDYPFDGLCGAGVMFKLLLQLYWEMDLDLGYVYDLLDIVAMGTVGDLVPLVDENRIIVKEGLKRTKREDRLVFKKLREALNISKIDEETFGYTYCPIINALGRLDGSPEDAIELLTTDDESRMEEIIKQLIDLNEKRKELTKQQEKLGIQMVESMSLLANVIVLHDDSFHEGIVGLVAGRLKEKYNRPVIVLASHEKDVVNKDGIKEAIKVYKGSARSIEGFHIKEVFDELKDYLVGYGGHAMAGGLSINPDRLEDFTNAINQKASEILTEEDYVKKVIIDTALSAKDVTVELIEEFEILKPFGMCFNKPRFGLKDYKVDFSKFKTPYVGEDFNTLRLVGETNLTLMMFKYANLYKELKEPKNIKAIGMPKLNVFNGNTTAQFVVEQDYLHLA